MKALAVFPLLLLVLVSASAQTPLTELATSDGARHDFFGTSVAVEGNTLVAGAPFANKVGHLSTGEAYVFVSAGNIWTQVAKLTPSDGDHDQFGSAVAISGSAIVVGGPNNNNQRGAVYLFVEPPGGWTDMTETAKLTVVAHYAGGLGKSVAISSDGNKVVTSGGPFPFVFVQPPGGWVSATSATAALTPPPGATAIATSFAMNGSTVAGGIAAPGGAVYVYDLNQNLTQSGRPRLVAPVATLSGSDSNCQTIGFSLAINGNTIVAGGGAVFTPGTVCVYVEPPTGWTDMTETARLNVSTSELIDLGMSVAVFGKTIVAGAPAQTVNGNLGQGAFYAYAQPPGGWVNTSTPNLERVASDGGTRDNLGFSIAISGKVVVAGAPNHAVNGNADQGAVYVLAP